MKGTGYFVDNRSWPGIESGIPLDELIAALDAITDDDVAAALASLAGDQ